MRSKPSYGVGVEVSAEMVAVARTGASAVRPIDAALPEEFEPDGKFDYVLFCDVGDIADIQKALLQTRAACEPHTRLLIYSCSDLWAPLIRRAERLHLKPSQAGQNWLAEQDLKGVLAGILARSSGSKTSSHRRLIPKISPCSPSS